MQLEKTFQNGKARFDTIDAQMAIMQKSLNEKTDDNALLSTKLANVLSETDLANAQTSELAKRLEIAGTQYAQSDLELNAARDALEKANQKHAKDTAEQTRIHTEAQTKIQSDFKNQMMQLMAQTKRLVFFLWAVFEIAGTAFPQSESSSSQATVSKVKRRVVEGHRGDITPTMKRVRGDVLSQGSSLGGSVLNDWTRKVPSTARQDLALPNPQKPSQTHVFLVAPQLYTIPVLVNNFLAPSFKNDPKFKDNRQEQITCLVTMCSKGSFVDRAEDADIVMRTDEDTDEYPVKSPTWTTFISLIPYSQK
ncbi:hypothetical protein BSLG_005652 [Batrachochytrium salamandrivorans]|nr:hypothetical protein BSLG_005652 [Batrachochytrium salamandrivorans]